MIGQFAHGVQIDVAAKEKFPFHRRKPLGRIRLFYGFSKVIGMDVHSLQLQCTVLIAVYYGSRLVRAL